MNELIENDKTHWQWYKMKSENCLHGWKQKSICKKLRKILVKTM